MRYQEEITHSQRVALSILISLLLIAFIAYEIYDPLIRFFKEESAKREVERELQKWKELV